MAVRKWEIKTSGVLVTTVWSELRDIAVAYRVRNDGPGTVVVHIIGSNPALKPGEDQDIVAPGGMSIELTSGAKASGTIDFLGMAARHSTTSTSAAKTRSRTKK